MSLFLFASGDQEVQGTVAQFAGRFRPSTFGANRRVNKSCWQRIVLFGWRHISVAIETAGAAAV